MLSGRADNGKVFGVATSKAAARELKYEEPTYLTAKIYAQGSHQTKLLYEFKRVATRSGATLKVQRDFTYPDGKLAARERVIYEGDNLVLYELEERQIGAAGRASVRHSPENPAKGSIEFEYAKEAGSKPKVRTEALANHTLINDMVGPFLVSHWDALMRGEKLKCRYIVVPRLETVGFTFFKEAEPVWQGRKLIRVRMEASSPFVAALVDPLSFTIEQAPPHRVLQYVGRTTPKISVGGKWKDLDAVTVFDWETAR
ncbi:MAG TPA: hypothetical protein VNZ22_04820 [Bacillota bacterium]|nr:hypothetical protein [Bacillota bacterium]